MLVRDREGGESTALAKVQTKRVAAEVAADRYSSQLKNEGRFIQRTV